MYVCALRNEGLMISVENWQNEWGDFYNFAQKDDCLITNAGDLHKYK